MIKTYAHALTTIAALLALLGSTLIGRTQPAPSQADRKCLLWAPSTFSYKLTGLLDGESLKWIKAAEPVFIKHHVDSSQWVIFVSNDDENVYVTLTTKERAMNLDRLGGTGFAVTISKKDINIMRFSGLK